MNYPARRSMLLSALLGASAWAADDHVAAPQENVASVAHGERQVSAHVAQLLAASLPPSVPVAAPAKSPAPVPVETNDAGKPANGIVRLPRYLVREPKLPTPMEIMTKGELEQYAMKRYLGPEDGLDRGVLNLFTIAGVWKKIPVLKYFPFVTSETNEDRALRLHDVAERKRKLEELGSLMSIKPRPGESTLPEKENAK